MCSFYGKTHFQEQKKKMIAARRAALESGDEKTYKEIVMQMTQQEEMLIQSKLSQILEKLGISEQEFQQNTMFHGQDQRKGMQLMQMQQQTMPNTEAIESLNKQKTIDTFKVQQDIQMESMDAMLQDGMGGEP